MCYRSRWLLLVPLRASNIFVTSPYIARLGHACRLSFRLAISTTVCLTLDLTESIPRLSGLDLTPTTLGICFPTRSPLTLTSLSNLHFRFRLRLHFQRQQIYTHVCIISPTVFTLTFTLITRGQNFCLCPQRCSFIFTSLDIYLRSTRHDCTHIYNIPPQCFACFYTSPVFFFYFLFLIIFFFDRSLYDWYFVSFLYLPLLSSSLSLSLSHLTCVT